MFEMGFYQEKIRKTRALALISSSNQVAMFGLQRLDKLS
jgi:hypothetical protein